MGEGKDFKTREGNFYLKGTLKKGVFTGKGLSLGRKKLGIFSPKFYSRIGDFLKGQGWLHILGIRIIPVVRIFQFFYLFWISKGEQGKTDFLGKRSWISINRFHKDGIHWRLFEQETRVQPSPTGGGGIFL